MKPIPFLIISTLALSACADRRTEASAPVAPEPASPAASETQAPVIGMANPASVHCGEIGGRLEIREGEGGQYGVCIFEDGRQCEEWSLLRDNRCVAPEDVPGLLPDNAGKGV